MNITREQAIRLLSKAHDQYHNEYGISSWEEDCAHDFIKIHENTPTGEDCLKSIGVTQKEIDDALKQ